MPKLNKVSYLAFLDKKFIYQIYQIIQRFSISDVFNVSNCGFLTCCGIFLSFIIFLILILLHKYIKSIQAKPSTEKQQKMQAIIEKYKREILNTSMNQFYSISTENRGNKSIDLEKSQDRSIEASSSEQKQLQGNLSLDQDNYLVASNTERLAQARQIEDQQQNPEQQEQINFRQTTNNCLQQLNTSSNVSPSRRLIKNIKTNYNICARISKFLLTGNPICSLFYKESNFFPKHVRLSLVYFQLLLTFFVGSIVCIYYENQKQGDQFEVYKIIETTIISSILSQLGFYALVAVIVTRKEKISRTRNDRVFFERLMNFEREQKFKIIFLYVFNFFSFFGMLFQFSAFTSITESSNLKHIWIVSTILTLIFYNLIIDVAFLIGLSILYVKAYKSKKLKIIYRQIDSLRVWAI